MHDAVQMLLKGFFLMKTNNPAAFGARNDLESALMAVNDSLALEVEV